MAESTENQNDLKKQGNSMELGGNITLKGFGEMEPAKLVVVKKMVGNYAKNISEKKEFDNLTVELKDEKINIVLKIKDEELKVESSEKNMFFAINESMDKLKEQVK